MNLRFSTVKIDVPAPRTKSGDLMVETAELELIHRDLLEVSVDLINAPSQRGWIHWRFIPEFCSDMDGQTVLSETEKSDADNADVPVYRSVSELWTGDWWQQQERELPLNSEKRILAIGIATDETAVTMTGG